MDFETTIRLHLNLSIEYFIEQLTIFAHTIFTYNITYNIQLRFHVCERGRVEQNCLDVIR